METVRYAESFSLSSREKDAAQEPTRGFKNVLRLTRGVSASLFTHAC